jgi:hypothetical protein
LGLLTVRSVIIPAGRRRSRASIGTGIMVRHEGAKEGLGN